MFLSKLVELSSDKSGSLETYSSSEEVLTFLVCLDGGMGASLQVDRQVDHNQIGNKLVKIKKSMKTNGAFFVYKKIVKHEELGLLFYWVFHCCVPKQICVFIVI